MRIRLAAHQPRSLKSERVCDHHFGLALETDQSATQAGTPACTSPIRAIVIDFLPSDGLVACDEAIEELRKSE